MSTFRTTTCYILSVFLFLAASASAETRYVCLKGSADSPFTSWKTAARDIASALDVAVEGDQIVVAPGTYPTHRTMVVNRAVSLRNSCTVDPLFVSDKDFRLRPDSPCIDAGRNEDWMIEAVDAAGRPRIRNKVVDVGAYEFNCDALVLSPEPDGNVSTTGLNSDEDGWIALARLVRADRDLQNAGWKWDGHSAVFSAGKPRALVSIPVRIAGSYELQTRVTIARAKEVTAIYLPITDTRAVVLGMRGDRGNSESPTATIRLTGLQPAAEPHDKVSMKIGTEYALSCKVLAVTSKVTIEIRRDGRVLFRWIGDAAQVAEQSLMRPGTVQLETAYYTTSRFTGLRLRMFSGKATPLFSE